MMEQITLDMIPNSHTPIAHISQYDSGRHIRFNLQNITLTGSETVTLKIRKTDGELVSKFIENHTSYVEYVSETADCDVSGKANCEFVISKDDVVIGSKNFIMKVEADAYDGANVVTKTASGAIASFETNLADLLQSLKCEINASGGNGTPSNPIPIVGHTELNLTRCGVNLWDEDMEVGSISWGNGEPYVDNTRMRFADFVRVSEGISIYIVCPAAYDIHVYDINKSHLTAVYKSEGGAYTIPANGAYIKITTQAAYGTTYNNNISINYPATDTEYHPYMGDTATISFGQTIFGGSYDANSGNIPITHRKYPLSDMEWDYRGGFFRTNSIASDVKKPDSQTTLTDSKCEIFKNVTWHDVGNNDNEYAILGPTSGELIVKCSSCSNLTEWATLIEGYSLAYELATPIEIDVQAISPSAVVGTNNVFGDTGDTEVKYLYIA